ncbi:hypothetical protein EPUS_05706 [Endocarpon pusillum Z07020]|uniref:Uncharacterized protein n=1 Tax=Endocarpon pusillum (strain Z07020 / HMAS-L-300199) TaxID=1263415 RepID=U1G5Q7_ENDPU|nr:uncharacterized protein EPUS_05706 [Endocarpon pusillum Z07020]ERF72652.1 hypothetical protein EPUS_05706 [Endocarpon pusillum Z07020]
MRRPFDRTRRQASTVAIRLCFWERTGRSRKLEVTNIFFGMKDGTMRTLRLNDTVLDSITRTSVISLAKRRAIEVEERDYYFVDFYDDVMHGEVSEVFGCGTACSLVAISSFYYPSREAKTGSNKSAVEFDINGEDPFGWRYEIRVQDLPLFSWEKNVHRYGLSLPAISYAGRLTSKRV